MKIKCERFFLVMERVDEVWFRESMGGNRTFWTKRQYMFSRESVGAVSIYSVGSL